jgi:hypothetical protein
MKNVPPFTRLRWPLAKSGSIGDFSLSFSLSLSLSPSSPGLKACGTVEKCGMRGQNSSSSSFASCFFLYLLFLLLLLILLLLMDSNPFPLGSSERDAVGPSRRRRRPRTSRDLRQWAASKAAIVQGKEKGMSLFALNMLPAVSFLVHS